jgi:S-adenosylmethionine uptake transporter
MTGAMAAFTVNDTFLKLLGTDLPLFQILLLRSIGVIVVLGLIARRSGAVRLPSRSRDRWLIVIRSIAEAAAAWFFITALFHMPIANVSAILQALPLTVTLAAALFLGEPVGWRRFSAIVVGFVGVYLIVRPGSSAFTIDSLYAIASVVCVTVRDLAARQLSSEVRSMTVALATGLFVGLFSLVGALFVDWQPMNADHYIWLACAVVMVIGGYIFSVMAMRVGEISAVAPFRYASLLVALVAGYFVFGDWPDNMTLLGAFIVVATGLFTLWRERARYNPGPVPLRTR